jgi:hypothetical protein
MIHKATATDAGCWIDGHWGQYGIARMVEIAAAHGFADTGIINLASRHLGTMGPAANPGLELSDDEHESLSWAADAVEQWLNDSVAPEGYSFGWYDGEFFLWSTHTWHEGDGDDDPDCEECFPRRRFTLTIECANAAFSEGNGEVSRILRAIADRLESSDEFADGTAIVDLNGNRVGTYAFESAE